MYPVTTKLDPVALAREFGRYGYSREGIASL